MSRQVEERVTTLEANQRHHKEELLELKNAVKNQKEELDELIGNLKSIKNILYGIFSGITLNLADTLGLLTKISNLIGGN